MKILIAEDDFASRKFMLKFLSKYADVDVTVDGEEAAAAFELALEDESPYDLVCLDIMMPNVNGIEALEAIRKAEERHGVDRSRRSKIIMTTALNEVNQVEQAFELGCEGYAVKPIDTARFLVIMKKMGFDLKEEE
ncbi:MAG: response regulator [Lachnospiraceae bacterium]|nr:response regulator [Lachnospiraceae bacterium]MBP5184210.1 response regulator [Lachnospiraceae bacterium]